MPFTQYYGQFQGFRGNLGGVPPWGRGLLVLAAVPGLVVVLAGALLLVTGVLLVLLLVLPIYRLLRLFTAGGVSTAGTEIHDADMLPSGRKAVESRIV